MRFIIFLLLGYIGFRIVRAFLTARETAATSAGADTETFQDPVCGVYVTADDAVIGLVETRRVYFCSISCLEKYRKCFNKT